VSEVIAATTVYPRPWRAVASFLSVSGIRRAGYAVLGLQLVGFLVWSTLEYHRFALAMDFTQFNQAWYAIAHGHLNPVDSIKGYSYWRDHAAFITWPMALLYWVWPHSPLLLWLQDIGTVAAELLAFTWLCELAQRYRRGRGAAWLAGAGLVLLAVNPWMGWAVTFDFHLEPLAMPLVVLLARDLVNGRRRAWVWVVPLLACGDVVCTYLVGVGLGGVLAGRRSRLTGALVAGVGLAATLVITLLHADRGSGGGLQAYAYLAAAPSAAGLSVGALAKGMIAHPLGVLRALWAKKLDIWANLAPSGLIGIAFIPVLPICAIILLENNLPVTLIFSRPSFQSLPLYVLIPVGTVGMLGWLSRRHIRLANLLTAILAAEALAWAAVWVPPTPGEWIRVPGATAATLAAVEERIPVSAEVIASSGITGRFSDHADVYGLFTLTNYRIPVSGNTWFVIAPLAGIEGQTTASAMALVGELAGPLHAVLVTHVHGVWAFRWRPPPGVHSIVVPDERTALQAWTAPLSPGTAGHRVMTGPVGDWRVISSGGRGYIADGIAWQRPPGRYQAFVTLSTSGPVNVEVWNDTGNVLLARRGIPATTGVETVELPVDALTEYRSSVYTGWGPFRAALIPPPPGNRLEVRVWSPGGATVNVYSAELAAGSRMAINH
jgi:hypothetical protein